MMHSLLSFRYVVRDLLSFKEKDASFLSMTEYDNKYFEIADSAEIKGGKFLISGYLDKPTLAMLKIDSVVVRFHIDTVAMTLTLSTKDPNNFKLEGSSTRNDQLEIEVEYSKFSTEFEPIKNALTNIDSLISVETNEIDAKLEEIFGE